MKTKFKGIKTAAEHRRGELVRDLLKMIGAGVIVGAAAVAAPNTLQLLQYLEPKNRSQRQKIWSAIKYLERHGDIKVHTAGDSDYVELTRQGKLRLQSDAIWELQLEAPRRWDRKWRMVMFDFPSGAVKRHEFRAKLEDFGFQMYQRSVFIYPHECREEVFALAKWLELKEYIRYVVATEIHDMRHFVRSFDLL